MHAWSIYMHARFMLHALLYMHAHCTLCTVISSPASRTLTFTSHNITTAAILTWAVLCTVYTISIVWAIWGENTKTELTANVNAKKGKFSNGWTFAIFPTPATYHSVFHFRACFPLTFIQFYLHKYKENVHKKAETNAHHVDMIVHEIQLDSCSLRWHGYKFLHFDRYSDSHSWLHTNHVDRLHENVKFKTQ